MADCKNCSTTISDGNIMECPNCGATLCTRCASQTKNICPYCYSDLNYVG